MENLIDYFYDMNLEIPTLNKGDLIEIVAPAKAIDKESVETAKSYLETQGFRVKVSPNCLGQNNYFSGTLEERLADLQSAIDNPSVKAILCARGGYGCVQLVDKLQWAGMLRDPKWLIGFSDVTVFHQRMNVLGLQSIHGTMPLNFSMNSKMALDTLVDAMLGKKYVINSESSSMNKKGACEGVLRGGNLSILYSLLGTNDEGDYFGCVLYIEDLAEHLYHIDRIFYAFDKAGILDRIKGLIVGGMTNLKDTNPGFGSTYEEIILSHFAYRKIPVCFNFPAGHINDNRALILGKTVRLEVNTADVLLSFL